jgi:hypothetical protein
MAPSDLTHRELVEILCTLLRNFVRLILGNFMPECYGKFLGAAPSGPARALSVIDKSLAPQWNAVAEAIAGLTRESAASLPLRSGHWPLSGRRTHRHHRQKKGARG